jgi:hypothetical protein
MNPHYVTSKTKIVDPEILSKFIHKNPQQWGLMWIETPKPLKLVD